MILVLSENGDLSTNDVLKWLDYFGVEWTRINEDDRVEFTSLKYIDNRIKHFIITVNGQAIDLLDVKAYWYRRGWLNTSEQFLRAKISLNNMIKQEIQTYLKHELRNL